MTIGADKVRQLRDQTGAGMMDCKRALEATGGDLARAVDSLRKEGLIKAAKKAGRSTAEGLIGEASVPGAAALVELNCETDFVARTDDFVGFLSRLATHVLERSPKDLSELLKQPFTGGTVQEALAAVIAKLGENMGIRRFVRIAAGPGEVLGHYLHTGSKIGVIIRLRGPADAASAAREVAMHVAAMHPRYGRRDQVPAEVLESEKEIIRALPELAGKPPQVVDRIVEGKLNRFFADSCLVEQPFIRDPAGKKSVGAFLKEAMPGVELVDFIRYQVGEGTS